MYPTLLFSLKVSDMLRSFHSPLNLCAPLPGESKGGVSSTSAGMIGESNRACITGESNRRDAIDAGRNGETSKCPSSTKVIIMPGSTSSRASGIPITGIDRMMLLQKDVLSSSESFCHRTSIFEKTENKIHGTSTFIFFFYNFFFFYY